MAKAAVLDTSLQHTHEWLHEIGQELGFDDERAAYAALRATLHAVRDRLPAELVAHFGAELPMLVRGIYYDGWHPSAARLKAAHDEDFLDSIGGELLGHDELEDVEARCRSGAARRQSPDRARADRSRPGCAAGEGAPAMAQGAAGRRHPVTSAASARRERTRDITIGPVGLDGMLGLPEASAGIVLFAHGSGSGRFSPRNNFVARALREAGFATLLFDLLTEEEAQDRANVFDIPLLAERLSMATAWVKQDPDTAALPIGYFGASTGAAAALVAAASGAWPIAAIVSRGGRPDLAGAALRESHGADAADRRRRRPDGPRPEPHGARRAALRKAPRGGARRDAPVRGAGRARNGGRSRRQLVRVASGERRVMMFQDRSDAGRRLAEKLAHLKDQEAGRAGPAARRRAGRLRDRPRARCAARPRAGAQDRRAVAARTRARRRHRRRDSRKPSSTGNWPRRWISPTIT